MIFMETRINRIIAIAGKMNDFRIALNVLENKKEK